MLDPRGKLLRVTSLVACPALLQELSVVAHRKRFRRWLSIEAMERLIDTLALIAEMHQSSLYSPANAQATGSGLPLPPHR